MCLKFKITNSGVCVCCSSLHSSRSHDESDALHFCFLSHFTFETASADPFTFEYAHSVRTVHSQSIVAPDCGMDG